MKTLAILFSVLFILARPAWSQSVGIPYIAEVDLSTVGDSVVLFVAPPWQDFRSVRIVAAGWGGFDSLYIGYRGDNGGKTYPHRLAALSPLNLPSDTTLVQPADMRASAFAINYTDDAGLTVGITSDETYAELTGMEFSDSILIANGDAIIIPPYMGGLYSIGHGESFTSNVDNTAAHVAVFLNGTKLEETTLQQKIGTAGELGSSSRPQVVSSNTILAPGDVLDLRFAGDKDGTITVNHATLVARPYALERYYTRAWTEVVLYLKGGAGSETGKAIIIAE